MSLANLSALATQDSCAESSSNPSIERSGGAPAKRSSKRDRRPTRTLDEVWIAEQQQKQQQQMEVLSSSSNESDGSRRRSPRAKKMNCSAKMEQPTEAQEKDDIVPAKKKAAVKKRRHQKSKHKKKASSPPNKKKKARNTHRSCLWGKERKWTKAEDKIILRTVTEYRHKQAQDKSKVLSFWTQLADRFGTPVKRVRDRYVNHLDPKINRSPFSREDDLRLWGAHKTLGNEWQKICHLYFAGSRPGEVLRARWKTKGFKALITDEFGPDAYENEHNLLTSSQREGCHQLLFGYSMDGLACDVLFRIASFVPSIKSLMSFCSTSKQTNMLLKDKYLSENLYRSLFIKRFDMSPVASEHFGTTWKDRWVGVAALKKSMEAIEDDKCSIILPNTLGVLRPPAYEESAIFYDNPRFDPGESSHGYFGLHVLSNLSRPPNATVDWEPPLLLHGDFDGVKIFSSLVHVTNGSDSSSSPYRFLSLGDDGVDGGQVLSCILSPSNMEIESDEEESIAPPVAFIGYASGRVASIHAMLSNDGASYTFSLSSYWHAHKSEVTCLAVGNFYDENNTPHPMLFSACCGGEVYCYPSYKQSVLACWNDVYCPIFSMTSTEVCDEGYTYGILVTGDKSGMVKLWSIGEVGTVFKKLVGGQGGGDNHPVTIASTIGGNMFVTGNNNGDLRFWSVSYKELRGIINVELKLRRDIPGAHVGSIEWCMNVGNILLTSGGNDGRIFGWDLNSHKRVGCLSCHQGKNIRLPGRSKNVHMKSCVVSAILPVTSKGKLITLCRDGVMGYWTYIATE